MNPLVSQFIAEAREYLEEAGRGLLALEKSCRDKDVVNAIFRNFHTLKGTSGIFPEFAPITSVTHAAEDLMDGVRNERFELTAEMSDQLFATIDLITDWMNELAADRALPADAEKEGGELKGRLKKLLPETAAEDGGSTIPGPVAKEKRGGASTALAWLAELSEEERENACRTLGDGEGELTSIVYTPEENAFFFGDDPLHLMRQIRECVVFRVECTDLWPPLTGFDPFVCRLRFKLLTRMPLAEVRLLLRYVEEQAVLEEVQPEHLAIQFAPTVAPQAAKESEARPADRAPAKTYKIDHIIINKMMTLIGELIVAKNGLPYLRQQAKVKYRIDELAREIDQRYNTLNIIVENLQDVIMEVRMLPAASVFQRFPRLVRDLSHKLGKQIELVLEGEETCADKDVIEALSEPLIHLVRNSIDHAIELPHERTAAGKPAEGTITLRAFAEGANVVMEIVDDGKGIDPELIRRKAFEKGLYAKEALDSMSDEDVVALVFAPNFSTADQISDLSGRGVGMDVVSTAVERFGGSVHITSTKGEGTRVRLVLPLSMAITKVLIAKEAGNYYGLPADVVMETLEMKNESLAAMNSHDMFPFRGRPVPVFRLQELLNGPDYERSTSNRTSLVFVKVKGETVGLAVESLSDIVDAVVKPTEGVMANYPSFTGTTILGDGNIMLVLNLQEVICH